MKMTDRLRLDKSRAQHNTETGQSDRRGSPENRQTSPAAGRKHSGKRPEKKARTALRCPLVASVEVIDLQSNTKLIARISELAIGGCYVDALNPFAVGAMAKIRINRDRGTFETKAKVVYRHEGFGMGLAFTEIAPDQRSILEDWLAEIITQRKPT